MKQLYQKLSLFLLPLLLALVFIPVDKRLKYEGLRNDCFNHGIWIHDRIFENEKEIDIAFLGSSQSLNAVEDRLLEEVLGKYSVANLAYCRLGRNLSYILLKELLRKKKPKTLILELRNTENKFPHPIFPLLAESKELILTNPLFYKGQFEDLYEHGAYKIGILQKMSLGSRKRAAIRKEDFGHSNSPDTADFAYLEQRKERLLAKEVSDWNQRLDDQFPKSYVEKMMEICQKNNIQVYFLFLPVYGLADKAPFEKEFYEAYGEILYPPKTLLNNPDFWHDDKHLNTAGSYKFSLWLGEILKEKLE